MVSSKEFQDLIQKLESNVQEDSSSRKLTVFLCGGAQYKDEEKKEERDNVRNAIYNSLLDHNRVKFIFAENVTKAFVEKSSEGHNLVELEKFIINNTDITLLIPESPGSYCELGLFSTQNLKDLKKLFIIIDKEFEPTVQIENKKANSFINFGPIKYLKEKRRSTNIRYCSKEHYMDREYLAGFLKIRKFNLKKRYGALMHSYNLVMGLLYFGGLLTFYQIKSLLIFNSNLLLNKTAQDQEMLIKMSLDQLESDNFLEIDESNTPRVINLNTRGKVFFEKTFNPGDMDKKKISLRLQKYLLYNFD